MPPKRGTKTVQKTKVALKATRTACKAPAVKQVEIKRKGRPPKAAPKVKKEPMSISLEDIVKDKTISTCDECGGVWFKKELFDKHLISCGAPKVKTDNAYLAQNTARSKGKHDDDIQVIKEVPVVNGRGKSVSVLSLKRKRKHEEEVLTVGAEVEIIKNINRKNENTAGPQSFMSTKDQPSTSFGLKDELKTISASNLRKNIASSMQKNTPSAPLRPRRSSGPISEVEVLSAKAGIQNMTAVKKISLTGSSDAITLLHSNPTASEEVMIKKETLPTRGRGRKPRQQEPSITIKKEIAIITIKEEKDDETEERRALPPATVGSEISNDAHDVDDPGTSSESVDDPDKDSNAFVFNCAVCKKAFTKKYLLDRHLNSSKCSSLPRPSFPCKLCNKVYSRKDNLREHLRSHSGKGQRRKDHQCQYCDKAFHAHSLLVIHERKHTGEMPFTCDFCQKGFPSAGAMSRHRMTHTGEKPYACDECGHRFTLKGTLSRHIRTHTGIRPYACTFCSKTFIQIGGLKAHMFYHTGKNGFKCEDCGKVFNSKARLQMHQLFVHLKLKPFVCELCSKPFTRKEDLIRHTALHTGEKPFQCPTCDKRFTVKKSLKLHLLTHTKEEPRSCHECGRAFSRKDTLLRHMKKRHWDVFDKLFLDEKDASIVNTRVLSEKDLTENIKEVLYLLIDEQTLSGFGWPDKPVDQILELVIQRNGHTPVSKDLYTFTDRLRENAKLLFTVVIDDNSIKTLLNNRTIDEVILHVLGLAKS